MAKHKLGFHINAISTPVANAIVNIRPKLIKTLHHDANFWKKARQLLPDTFILGRLFTPNQNFTDNPAKRGREFADRILQEEVNSLEVNGKPVYDAWESFNEIMTERASDDHQKLYDEFQVAFAEKMRAEGFESVAMNFGTGNFLDKQFLRNFQGTLQSYKYLGFHEYDFPTLDRLHKIGLADGNGGMWLALRYRRIMQKVREQFPNQHTAIITELGMTQGVLGGRDVGPWDISHPISPDDYWQSLQWYNQEILKDNYAMGACLFVVGAIHPWESFEHLGVMLDKLAAYQNEPPTDGASDIPPADTPPPATDGASDIPPADTPPPATDGASDIPPADTPPPATDGASDIPPADSPPPATDGASDIPPADTPPPAFPGADSDAGTPAPIIGSDEVSITMPVNVANYHSHYFLFPKKSGAWWYAAAEDYFEFFGVTRGEKLEDALFLRGTQGHTITCLNPAADVLAKIQQLNPTAKIDALNVSSPAKLSEILGNRILQNTAFE